MYHRSLGLALGWCLVLAGLVPALLLWLVARWHLSRRAASRLPRHGVRSPSVGFFHPACFGGGGGERVLWCAVRALQQQHADVQIVIYASPTDHLATRLASIKDTFNVDVDTRRLQFVWLAGTHLLEASRWPRFTMFGQSFGSLVVAWQGLSQIRVDYFVDTTGYAWALALAHLLGCTAVAYVHYPTISTDMLAVVQAGTESHNNTRRTSSGLGRHVKLVYYELFAFLYGLAGRAASVVMVNSKWTQAHVDHIWGKRAQTILVYPPCDTETLQRIPLAWDKREPLVVSIGQFRPEKDHALQLRAFAQMARAHGSRSAEVSAARLALIGGARNEADRAIVASLKSLAIELGIQDKVSFEIGISNEALRGWLARASVGIHTMWCEHFGIGVVEFMAAGVIPVAHNSGGPRADIVTEGETGMLASTADEYAQKMATIFQDRASFARVQARARASVDRFSEAAFERGFLAAMGRVLAASPSARI